MQETVDLFTSHIVEFWLDKMRKGESMKGAYLKGAQADKSTKILAPDFRAAILDEANLSHLDLSGADFSYASCEGAKFSRCDLRMATFHMANLDRSVFGRSIMDRANLSHASAHGAGFYNVRLAGAYMRSFKADELNLSCAELYGADLTNAEMRNVNAKDSCWCGVIAKEGDFRLGNFTNGVLHNVNFSMAQLQGAVFTCSNLSETDFRGANMEGVDLLGACLKHSDLRGATLTKISVCDADFNGALIDTPEGHKVIQLVPYLHKKGD